MNKIPLFDLKKSNDSIKLSSVVKSVIESNKLILGENLNLFEKNFAEYIGMKYCIGVGNGSDAIELALLAAGVKADDNVATVANAGFYTTAALNSISANPIYIDIDENNLLIDYLDLESKYKKYQFQYLVVTHLYGQPVDMVAIVKFCMQNHIIIIEDCAQAHGAEYKNKKVGSFGDISTFSFYPTKNLGAIGDAGAVLTNNEIFSKKLYQLRQYGWGEKYFVEILKGKNSRLDEIQAAILNIKLQTLDDLNLERRNISKYYIENINNIFVKPLTKILDGVSHLFVMKVENRDKFMKYLDLNGISTAIHYPVPDHLQPAFKNYKFDFKLNVTEKTSKEIVTLPLYPGMLQNEIEKVVKVVNEY